MMFLIRTAFWLVILILLLPTDEQQRTQIYGTAEATVHDVATFCDRNPATCETGRDAFGVLVQKAEYGAALLMQIINERSAEGSQGDSASIAPAGAEAAASEPPASSAEPPLWERADSQDTLRPEDRTTAWSAPNSGT